MSSAQSGQPTSFIDIDDKEIHNATIELLTRVKEGSTEPEDTYRVQYTLSDDSMYLTAEVSYAMYCSLKDYKKR